MSLLALLVIILFGLIVCSGVYAVFDEFRRIVRLHTWTRARAYILDSRLKETSGDNNSTWYNVEVEYQYEVDGSPYQRTVELMTIPDPLLEHAISLCNSHPPGSAFPIVYNPKQVDESEIADPAEFRMAPVLLLLFAIGLAAFLINFALNN